MSQKRYKELDVISLYRGNYKSEFYLRQISRLAKLPLKTCQSVLSRLEKDKVLRGKLEGRNKYFTLNLDNVQSKSLLLQAEIYKTNVFSEAYPQIRIFLKEISTNIPIIVFGSFARLKADKTSDMDLLIISEKEQKLPLHLLAYKVHKINIKEGDFTRALKENEAIIREISENHIILNNHSFYVNAMWEHYGR